MIRFSPKLSSQVRPPAVAGKFYPADAMELRCLIERFLREATPGDAPAPKAVIAPHAGCVYSGPVAVSAYVRLSPARGIVQRVVLLGPSHHAAFDGLATTGAERWATPLGDVPVDTRAVALICSLPQVRVLDAAHANEHSLEVHLPFLQVVLGTFRIVPLVVGTASDIEVAEVMEALWGGDETRFVISSDLSHYLDYKHARRVDAATARAIEELKPENISEEQACGRVAICGLLRVAQHHGLRAHTVDLRNSGDTSGPRDRVVGYGAWVF